MSDRVFVGIDVGSVSVDVAVVDEQQHVLEARYIRHRGRPMQVAAEALRDVQALYGDRIAALGATGDAARGLAERLGVPFVNEVVAQAAATGHLHPEVKTVVEIGGEDSKLVFLKRDATGRPDVADFAMNAMCAAGTGSFLDQQASRLGLSIEEFGRMALESEHPPRVAGRCSVFAKSDMIHLQQKATPTKDIVAGLCYALARNFKSTVGSAATFEPPVAFQGGVAANPGIVRALADVLELAEGQLLIPEHYGCMGAIGAAYQVMAAEARPLDLSGLDAVAQQEHRERQTLPPLKLDRSVIHAVDAIPPAPPADGSRIPAYLGVDVGSISTNVVVMDTAGTVLSKRYLMTAGAPIEAVRQGLQEVGDEVGDLVEIRGACTTGSGRYLIADFIGADLVRNEITAQARGALALDPTVDTIFEIGGQDSKYISLENGAVVDFEMNKVCAAGTGSFLEEQAEKLGISIKGEFGELALSAEHPVNLGERCTVFMETELVRHQQAGADLPDLVSGLAYSIVYNYLNRVVGTRRVGDNIFFQGGTAFNRATVAAFGQVTGKRITVPPHHEVTGALGCCLLAQEQDSGGGSRFKGFDLSRRRYSVTSFECDKCPNRCEINRVEVEGEEPLHYGDRCERYQRRKERRGEGIADLVAEREELLLAAYQPTRELPAEAPRVGVPRALLFHELYPFFHAVLTELGLRVVLSDKTNKRIIHEGAEASVAETCFPMKVALGHILNLLQKDVPYVFLPSVINLPKDDERLTDSFVCPYVQSLCYTAKAAVDFAAAGVEVLQPVIWLGVGAEKGADGLRAMARRFGRSAQDVTAAVAAGERALATFQQRMQERGREVLLELPADARALVIVSRAYNGCDPGANLEIPRKLRNMGVWAIPLDMLPVEEQRLPEAYANMYWHYGRKILQAADILASDSRLYPVYLTNFGCGPDSFLHRFFRERLGGRPCLMIEVDEHSADAGMITRCEAYMDSLANVDGRAFGNGHLPSPMGPLTGRTVLIPNMSGHAYALAAAFRACGLAAEVLPEADEETLYWGRKHTSGKECFPCCVTTGDMVKYTKRPDFDRHRTAFFMGGSGGPCRFGQYNTLQRIVLDELGYTDVPIFAPNQASRFYDDLGIVGRKFLHLGWKGIVAADVLEKAQRECRPYEVIIGSTDRAFQQCLDDLSRTVEADGDVVACMHRARAAFGELELDRSEPRPVIGLVGEFYIRSHAYSNQDLVAQIEALGGEVWAAPVYEWFLYRDFRRAMRAKLANDWGLYVKNALKDWVLKRDEHAITAPFADFLRNAHEPPTDEVLQLAAPYVHCSFEGEAIMTVGKALDFVRKGLAGVVSVMPFTCMPGTISQALLKLARAQEGEFPFLNMVYDGLEQSTALTRLEAFMHQARAYQTRRGGVVAVPTH